jgi:hypothetical protein
MCSFIEVAYGGFGPFFKKGKKANPLSFICFRSGVAAKLLLTIR